MRVGVVNLPDPAGENMIKDLFNGAWCRGARIGGASMPPLSLLYARSALQPFAEATTFIDAVHDQIPAVELTKLLRGCDLIVTHSSAYTWDDDVQTLGLIRAALPGSKIAIFGNIGSENVQSALDMGVADFVTTSDPEESFAELGAALTAGELEPDIAGLHRRGGPAPRSRSRTPLDGKPVPDRSPIVGKTYQNPLAAHPRWTSVLASRGCPFRCTFCNTPGYYDRYRRHSVEYVIDELKYVRSLGYRDVFFRDDLFFAGAVGELCEAMLSADLDLTWSCNHRVETLTPKTISVMARAGCHTIKFGVESGDETVLNEIGKAPKERARATFEACAQTGIRTHAHLMIGLPGETEEQVLRTVEFLHEIRPWTFSMGMFTPHPGSQLYTELKAAGALPTGGRWKEAVVGNPSNVSDDRLVQILRSTYLRYYLHPTRVMRFARDRRKWGTLIRASTGMLTKLATDRAA